MAKAEIILGESSGGVSKLNYDTIKQFVKSQSSYNAVVAQGSKTTVNDGGAYIDTENHMAYFFCDFDIATTATPSNYDRLVTIDGVTTILPDITAGNKNNIVIIDSTTATNSPKLYFYTYSSQTSVGATTKYTTGENFKVYAVWSTAGIA